MRGSTVMGLLPGDRFTLRDLLYGLMLPSGNDAALAIGRYVAGSDEAFVAEMNELVTRLGLSDSHFANPHGLGGVNHVTSAYDLAMLSRYGMSLPGFYDIVNTRHYWKAQGNRVIEVANITGFLRMYRGADGVKTGYTRNAGSTLAAGAWRDGHRLYAVILNSGSREADAIEPARTGPSTTTRGRRNERRVWLAPDLPAAVGARSSLRWSLVTPRPGRRRTRAARTRPPTANPEVPGRSAPPCCRRPELRRRPRTRRRSSCSTRGTAATRWARRATASSRRHSNLDMALRVEKLLLAAGYDVVLTRRDDTRVAFAPKGFTPTYWDLQARTDIANAAHGDVFVSIHSNGSDDTCQRGVEAWYDSKRADGPQNLQLAGHARTPTCWASCRPTATPPRTAACWTAAASASATAAASRCSSSAGRARRRVRT